MVIAQFTTTDIGALAERIAVAMKVRDTANDAASREILASVLGFATRQRNIVLHNR